MTPRPEHFDIIIVGAGVSGIGSAACLQRSRPGTCFVILDAQALVGGTWVTHRYPGIRSDSSLYTYGYSFKPWRGAHVASAAEIRAYLAGVIQDYDLAPHIRHSHQILTADWSDATSRWTLTARQTVTGQIHRFTCGFLWMCQGYYNHNAGHTPDWPGMADFTGQIVHPQTWPDGLDTTNKRVVVIGSGSTASTLIPALAQQAAHVTMLQRSTGYFFPPFPEDVFEKTLRGLDIDPAWVVEILRQKHLKEADDFVRQCRTDPDQTAKNLIAAVVAQLPAGFDVAKHFTPRYRPWRQRVALVPHGDFFAAIRSGKASVATDEIDHFTPDGIALASGEVLAANIIVTATGFEICVLGGIAFSNNGKPVNVAETVTWHGMMFTDLPNLAWVFGYLRASWTPRVELVAGFVLRLLAHMQATGTTKAVPVVRPSQQHMARLPWTDDQDFNAGYLMRGLHLMPRRLDTPEWMHTQDYRAEKPVFDRLDPGDGALQFSRATGLPTALVDTGAPVTLDAPNPSADPA